MPPRSDWARDARLLLDSSTVAHEHARPYPSDELTKVDQVLGQLRLGQVSAEGHASRRGEPEENDLDRVPTRRRQMQRSHLPTGRPASYGVPGR